MAEAELFFWKFHHDSEILNDVSHTAMTEEFKLDASYVYLTAGILLYPQIIENFYLNFLKLQEFHLFKWIHPRISIQME